MRERAARERGESGQAAIARVIAIAALAIGVVLTVIVLFGNGSGHQYKLLFETGGQLVPGNEVLVAGQAVGTVDELELTEDGQAEVHVTLDRPMMEGTTAAIRLTSLSGVANRYVALHMGPDSGEELPDGATLAADTTSSPVDLDQLFDVFDDPTRKALQNVIAGQATIYGGAEEEANKAYKFLAPGLDSTRRLLAELNSDQVAFEQFLVTGSRVLGAVAERRNDLSELTANANQALGAIAAENEAFDRSLAALPPAMRQANTTFVNLREALDDLDPLVATTGRSTEDLAPVLRELRPVAQKAVPVVGDLSDVFSRDGKNNDLTDALGALPGTERAADRAVPRAQAAIAQTQDEIEVLRPYTPDLLGWLAGLGQAAAAYDANGHYVRVQPAGANLFTWDDPADGDADGDGITSDLIPIPPSEQLADYFLPQFGTGPFLRCPGGSTQAIPLSNPFTDDGALTVPTGESAIPARCPPDEAAGRHRFGPRRGDRPGGHRDRGRRGGEVRGPRDLRQRRLPRHRGGGQDRRREGRRDLRGRRLRGRRGGARGRHRRVRDGGGRHGDRRAGLPGIPRGRLLHHQAAIAPRREVRRVQADGAPCSRFRAAARAGADSRGPAR